ncbi:hypothetical protein D3C75_679490 [compost metagenome]
MVAQELPRQFFQINPVRVAAFAALAAVGIKQLLQAPDRTVGGGVDAEDGDQPDDNRRQGHQQHRVTDPLGLGQKPLLLDDGHEAPAGLRRLQLIDQKLAALVGHFVGAVHRYLPDALADRLLVHLVVGGGVQHLILLVHDVAHPVEVVQDRRIQPGEQLVTLQVDGDNSLELPLDHDLAEQGDLRAFAPGPFRHLALLDEGHAVAEFLLDADPFRIHEGQAAGAVALGQGNEALPVQIIYVKAFHVLGIADQGGHQLVQLGNIGEGVLHLSGQKLVNPAVHRHLDGYLVALLDGFVDDIHVQLQHLPLGLAELLLQHRFGGVVGGQAHGQNDDENDYGLYQHEPCLGMGKVAFHPILEGLCHGLSPPYSQDAILIITRPLTRDTLLGVCPTKAKG